MSQIISYPCPNCGGKIEFNSSLQKMQCPFCDTEFEAETLKQFDQVLKEDGTDRLDWTEIPKEQWSEDDRNQLQSYVCTSCGGEVVVDRTTAATSCPFCSSPVVLTDRLAGDLKPELVIPFQIDFERAKSILQSHFKGKILLPKVFKDEHTVESVRGVYVPFWLFDLKADAHLRYAATKTRFWSDANYNYRKTSHFSVVRAGSIAFEAVPIDGSEKIDDTLMESIEPFDASKAVDFQTAYLSGFFADRYDVSGKDSIPRANERVKESTEAAFRSTVMGYDTVVPQSSTLSLEKGTVRYALYPVWLFQTTWKEEKYLFAINGQSGKIAGDLPVDRVAMLRWFLGLTGILSLAIVLIRLWLQF